MGNFLLKKHLHLTKLLAYFPNEAHLIMEIQANGGLLETCMEKKSDVPT